MKPDCIRAVALGTAVEFVSDTFEAAAHADPDGKVSFETASALFKLIRLTSHDLDLDLIQIGAKWAEDVEDAVTETVVAVMSGITRRGWHRGPIQRVWSSSAW